MRWRKDAHVIFVYQEDTLASITHPVSKLDRPAAADAPRMLDVSTSKGALCGHSFQVSAFRIPCEKLKPADEIS
jgi:hypothetical protein